MTARFLLVALLLALAPVLPAGASHQPCDGTFRVEHALPEGHGLIDVEMSSTEEGWAVGTRYSQTSNDRALAVRFDSDSYELHVLSDVTPKKRFVYLNALSVLSPTEIYAVGTADEHGLALRWDGSGWTRMQTPRRNRETFLRGVEAIASDDVWAVGDWHPKREVGKTFVIHYDGTEWSRVRAPDPGRSAILNDISASAPDDIWSVGTRYTRRYEHGLVLHWDRADWSKIAVPKWLRDNRSELHGVHAISSDEVWAVGRYFRGQKSFGLTLRWDGERWSFHEVPDVRGGEWLFDVDAAGDQTWSVGWRFDPENAYSYAVRWDGSDWSRVATERDDAYGYPDGVAAGEAGDAWAVATSMDSGALIQHAC